MNTTIVSNFFALSPHRVLECVEELGLKPTGFVTQLNSYENRVFDIRLEGGDRVIVKFYRPGRWSSETLQDEHDFLESLVREGIPAVAPKSFEKRTLFCSDVEDIWFSVFPRVIGRSPQEFTPHELIEVGERLAQLHNVGARQKPKARHRLTVDEFGRPGLDLLSQWIWPDLRNRYLDLGEELLERLHPLLDVNDMISIHGDCHKGNLLWGRDPSLTLEDVEPEKFFFVDFDDFCVGPVAQDVWMLLSPKGADRNEELDAILEGYTRLREWRDEWEELFEPLRALRLVTYSAWIARRWSDPSFPKLFPGFTTYLYWLEETEALEKILREMDP